MKKCVCSVLAKVGFAALALSLNFFAACEIGLGSSVDVEAPKIDFSENTLASGAVVRDAFAVLEAGLMMEALGLLMRLSKIWRPGLRQKKPELLAKIYGMSLSLQTKTLLQTVLTSFLS